MNLWRLDKIEHIERNGITFQINRSNPFARYDPITAILVGTKAVAATATAAAVPATAGLIGAEGAVTLGGLTTATAAGLGGYSAIQQGKAADVQASNQQKIADYNAQLQEREAKAARESAILEDKRLSKQQKLSESEQRARFSQSGISFTEGSPLELLISQAGDMALDRNLRLRRGLLGSNQAVSQSQLFKAQGSSARAIGRSEKSLSYFTSASNLVSPYAIKYQ